MAVNMERDAAGLRDHPDLDPETLSPAQPSRHNAPQPVEEFDTTAAETLTSMIGG